MRGALITTFMTAEQEQRAAQLDGKKHKVSHVEVLDLYLIRPGAPTEALAQELKLATPSVNRQLLALRNAGLLPDN